MAKTDEIKADLVEVKANVAESREDLQRVLELNQTQTKQIAGLETSLAELRKEVGELSKLDEIAAEVAALKGTTREMADVVAPPVVVPDEPVV